MEDWGADLSPCNFATTHFPAERSSFITRDHQFDSLHSEFLSPLNFATHETETLSQHPKFRKIPAPIKIKSALPPSPPNPQYLPPRKTRNFIDMEVFLQKKSRNSRRPYKIGAAISGPRIADKNFTDTRIFLTNDFETYLKREESSKALSTAIRMVFGLAFRCARFEVAANLWRFESLRTANRDSRQPEGAFCPLRNPPGGKLTKFPSRGPSPTKWESCPQKRDIRPPKRVNYTPKNTICNFAANFHQFQAHRSRSDFCDSQL